MKVQETIRLRSFENELAHLKTEIERLNIVIVDQKKSSKGDYYDLQDSNAKYIERIQNQNSNKYTKEFFFKILYIFLSG